MLWRRLEKSLLANDVAEKSSTPSYVEQAGRVLVLAVVWARDSSESARVAVAAASSSPVDVIQFSTS